MTPSSSVLITVHNAGSAIAGTLRAVAGELETSGSDAEIMLVDDRSTDDTVAAAQGSGAPGLRIVSVDDSRFDGITARQHAVHAGVLAANGDTVLMLDADAKTPPGWWRAMTRPIERGADIVVGGVTFAPAAPGLRCRLVAALQTVDVAYYLLVCRVLHALGLHSGLLFGNAAFRRGAYERVGGFPGIGFALTEDLAFARATHRAGCRFAFAPRPGVVVGACSSWRSLIARAKRVSTTGGPSALAAALGLWTGALVLLAAAAAAGGGVWMLAFLARYAIGVVAIALGTIRAGRPGLIAYALVYEAVAIVVSLCVLREIRRDPTIEWGGIVYDRRDAARSLAPQHRG